MHPRLIKNLRRSLIGLIIFVLLAVVFNYVHTWYQRARSLQKAAQILSSEVARSFNRIEYSEYKKGVLRFKISAKRLLESRRGKSYLEGIEAYDFNPDGSIHNEIRSKRAEYDRESKVANFSGDVRLFLNKGVELRTESLRYDLNSNVGTTPDKLRFISKGASGSARGIRFDQDQESLELNSEVDFVLTAINPNIIDSERPQQYRAASDRAFCTEQMHRMLFQGNAKIESESESLSGDSIEADLDPDRTRVTTMIAEGNGVYKSGDASAAQTLKGDRIVIGIGESRMLERIKVQGMAAFSSASEEGVELLQGEEIELEFDGTFRLLRLIHASNNVLFNRKRAREQLQLSGALLTAVFEPGTKNLQSIHVQKKASMIAEGGSSAARNELLADEIRMSFRQFRNRPIFEKLRADGSVRWVSTPQQPGTVGRQEAGRVLTASSLEMFYAKEEESFESGNAAGSVVVSESRNSSDSKAETRRMLADRMQFHFFPGNNRLRDVDADGHVQVIQQGNARSDAKSAVDKFRTSSDKMKAIFSLQNNVSTVESMTQWGNFRYTDASMSATAGRCDYDARAKKLVMRESPRIADEMNSTTGEWMEYEQTPGLLSVHGRVRSVLNTGKGTESFFASSSSSAPAIITADGMRYWKPDRRARYVGRVQLLSENGQLQAGTLEIVENGERVEAQDSIRHFIPQRPASETPASADKTIEVKKSEGRSMLIQSSYLKYIRGNNSIAYWGSVLVQSDDIVMGSDSLDILIAAGGKSVEHATARGKVNIRQGKRICKGDTADYFLDPQKFVLLGNPAEVDDPAKGKSFAGRLTSFIADDRILLENQ